MGNVFCVISMKNMEAELTTQQRSRVTTKKHSLTDQEMLIKIAKHFASLFPVQVRSGGADQSN